MVAGLAVVYMITGGSSMLRVWQLYGPTDTSFGLSAWILVFFGLQLILSQVGGGAPTHLHQTFSAAKPIHRSAC